MPNWPNGARAAISLTYDDNAPSQLDHAIPDLEAAGLRGTFYIVTGPKAQRSRDPEWREAFRRGHEMGNHTVTHPCRGGTGGLLTCTPEQILAEVQDADDWLNEHYGPDPDRSFAHPCGQTTIGPDDAQDSESYDAAICTRHRAARGVGAELNSAAGVLANPLRVQAICIHDTTPDAAERMIEYCIGASAVGGWGVLVFHGVGGDWHSTSRETHRRLITHLVEDRARYWVAPFRDVMKHLQQM